MSGLAPADWTSTTLADALDTIRNGLNCKQVKGEDGSSISRIETIADGEFNFERIGRASLTVEQKQKYRLSEGDILFSHINSPPHIGKSAILKSDAEIYHGVNLLLLRPRKGVDPYFLQNYINHLKVNGYWRSICKQSVNQASINQQDIKRTPFYFPPLEEQRRIVEILDRAFEGLARARENAEANLKSANELFDTSLIAVFEKIASETRSLKLEQAAIQFGRGRSRHRPRNAPFLYGGPYPFIQTGDVRNSDGIVATFQQTYSEDGLAQSKLWPKGTVCITIAANIAETGILGFDACFPDSIIGMVTDPEITFPEYVEFMLRFFSTDLKKQGKGSAQDNINLGTFEKAHFPFPPLSKQNTIVEKLTRLTDEKALLVEDYTNKTQDLHDLQQSLLQKAFSGQLT